MARNSLAHGQVWRTVGGDLVTLGSASNHEMWVVKDSPYKYQDHEWFMGSNKMVYCNVVVDGRKLFFSDVPTSADLKEQVE